jgi:hypothetical protein
MTTDVNAPVLVIDVYSINDVEESDPDPMYYHTANTVDELRMGLIDAIAYDVTLTFLFHDDAMHHDVYHVRNADDVVIAVVYIGNIE